MMIVMYLGLELCIPLTENHIEYALEVFLIIEMRSFVGYRKVGRKTSGFCGDVPAGQDVKRRECGTPWMYV